MSVTERLTAESISIAIRRLVRFARNVREVEQAIDRAGLGITNVIAKPEGPFMYKVWFKVPGDDTVREALCPCESDGDLRHEHDEND